ncbi:MAG: UDP-N-acetylglucosamine 1-carboxyvinyltransferase [Lentisphaeria bacterium]|nr:UDP-N-acetylglucosamine 1-carboxyvinyltransferase [Lentisphaeria bacterium]
MRSLEVEGGAGIQGEISVSGNKNAALPMIAACLLTSEPMILHNVPDILDVRTMLDIARSLGAEADFQDHTLRICCPAVKTATISRELCSRNRTSILFAAPLLVRAGRAVLSPPGGDVIGRRRLDGHFYGLEKLGGSMKFDGCYRFASKGRLAGCEMFLDEASVTATEQILIAAATASGHTTLYNAAGEPHVCDLANMLNAMGAKISGHGSNVIEIDGVDSLHGVEYTVQGDHIEAGSFLALAAVCGGGLVLNGTGPCRNYWMIRRTFEKLGILMDLQPDRIEIRPGQEMVIRNDFGGHLPTIADGPWPQFPSDMMSCTIVAATQAAGSVLFFEKMFESRIYFVDRLISMGAQAVVCDPHRVLITGKANLHAVEMSSPDIRAGMAMVIAALAARGTSRIHQADVIYRGYENLVDKLTAIGAKVREIN